MYSSTRGIVFRLTKYSDTSLIIRIFTEEFGLRSYLVKGARGPKSRMKSSLFQPLTLLDLVVTNNDKGELHHIREARVSYQYHSIPENIFKSSVLLFLNELLYKSIREESANDELFGFIYENLVGLDQVEKNLSHFHLLFAVNLTRYLGFFPQERYHGENSVFDLQEGCFTDNPPLFQNQVIRGPVCRYLSDLVTAGPQGLDSLSAGLIVRNELLDWLIAYYTLHLPISGEFRSHKVLHELFRDPQG
jgi:DNA repair protein RecO (recombination protein O)